MKRIIIIFSLILFLCTVKNSFSQSDKEKASKLVEKAITLMDNGKIDESIELLEEAQELDPDNPAIAYEIATANYLKKDYPKAINILINIKNKEPLEDIFSNIRK